jgi:thioredoxin reductase (NADPH)
MSEQRDVVIVGAGPIGLACGIAAQEAGLTYTILEKGCLVNSLYHYPLNMTFFSTSDRLEIGGVPFISHGPKPTRGEALEYYRRVCATHQLDVRLYEEVRTLQRLSESFRISTTRNSYESKAVILALGFFDRPFMLGVPGETLPKVKHYYDEPHPYFRQKVVVVGAANSAVDAALETWRKGADVTMVIREAHLRDSVKYWVKPDIENRIQEGSIRAYFNSSVVAIHEREVQISTPQGALTIENDFVFAMTGYEPPFAWMEQCGIAFRADEFRTPVYNEATMETNVPGLYLAGVVCGGLKTNKWFIENSRVHATQIINHLVGK